MTKGRFTLEELGVGVLRDKLEGSRTEEKIREGAMSKISPETLGKWQLYRVASRTSLSS
jgi:hypothetical protein